MNTLPYEQALAQRWAIAGTVPLSDTAPGAAWYRAENVHTRERVVLFVVTGDRAMEVADAARRASLIEDPHLLSITRVWVLDEQGNVADGPDYSPSASAERFVAVEYPMPPAPPLAALLKQGALRPETARSIIGEAATGLESARRRGVRHQFLDSNRVFVDVNTGDVTVLGVGVEAASHADVDRSGPIASFHDASALVALLYRCLTGRAPRPLPDGSVQRPTALVERPLPPELDQLCYVVLNENGGHIPQTVQDLVAEIEPWQSIPVTLQAYDAFERQQARQATSASALSAPSAPSASSAPPAPGFSPPSIPSAQSAPSASSAAPGPAFSAPSPPPGPTFSAPSPPPGPAFSPPPASSPTSSAGAHFGHAPATPSGGNASNSSLGYQAGPGSAYDSARTTADTDYSDFGSPPGGSSVLDSTDMHAVLVATGQLELFEPGAEPALLESKRSQQEPAKTDPSTAESSEEQRREEAHEAEELVEQFHLTTERAKSAFPAAMSIPVPSGPTAGTARTQNAPHSYDEHADSSVHNGMREDDSFDRPRPGEKLWGDYAAATGFAKPPHDPSEQFRLAGQPGDEMPDRSGSRLASEFSAEPKPDQHSGNDSGSWREPGSGSSANAREAVRFDEPNASLAPVVGSERAARMQNDHDSRAAVHSAQDSESDWSIEGYEDLEATRPARDRHSATAVSSGGVNDLGYSHRSSDPSGGDESVYSSDGDWSEDDDPTHTALQPVGAGGSAAGADSPSTDGGHSGPVVVRGRGESSARGGSGPIVVAGRDTSIAAVAARATADDDDQWSRSSLLRDVVSVATDRDEVGDTFVMGGRDPEERSQHATWILAGAALLAAVAFVFALTTATSGLRQRIANPLGTDSPTVSAEPTTEEGDQGEEGGEDQAKPEEEQPTAPAPAISAVEVFDDGSGNGPDNADQVGRMTDGNPETFWSTRYYRTPEFGGLMEGNGVRVTFNELSTVSDVVLTTARNTGGVIELRAVQEDGSVSDVIATGEFAGDGQVRLTPDQPVEATAIELWIPTLPPDSKEPGNFRGRIAEIAVE